MTETAPRAVAGIVATLASKAATGSGLRLTAREVRVVLDALSKSQPPVASDETEAEKLAAIIATKRMHTNGSLDAARATAEAILAAGYRLSPVDRREFRFTDKQWRTYQQIPEQGYSHRHHLERVVNQWLASSPPVDRATLTVDNVKMLGETLCAAKATIGRSASDRAEEHSARIGDLIAQLDVHRPLGTNGKHGNLHTPTCGCDDVRTLATVQPTEVIQ